MAVFTDYLWFKTKKRQEFIRITDEVATIVQKVLAPGLLGAEPVPRQHPTGIFHRGRGGTL